MNREYWLTCSMCTVSVTCDDRDVIVKAAPLARKFLGQPLANLQAWLQKYGGYECRPVNRQADLFGA